MQIGIVMTFASVYQMLRASLVVFTRNAFCLPLSPSLSLSLPLSLSLSPSPSPSLSLSLSLSFYLSLSLSYQYLPDGLSLFHTDHVLYLFGLETLCTVVLGMIVHHHRPVASQWIGVVIVMSGVPIVLMVSLLEAQNSDQAPNPVLGDVLVLLGQLTMAIQVCEWGSKN
jgi:drug/metabolite transporter (DMT)-like permease